jgi:hypothetical protein
MMTKIIPIKFSHTVLRMFINALEPSGNFIYQSTKVLLFVRLVINIRVKERVYSIFKSKVHIYSRNKMHGIKHGMCMVFCTPS